MVQSKSCGLHALELSWEFARGMHVQASIDEVRWQADATEAFLQLVKCHCQQLVSLTGDAPLKPENQWQQYYHTNT